MILKIKILDILKKAFFIGFHLKYIFANDRRSKLIYFDDIFC